MKKLILDRGVKIYAHLEENGNHYVIPPVAQPKAFAGNVFLWALDEEEDTCSLFQTTGGYLKSTTGKLWKEMSHS